jgi:hypothetical protein
LRCRPLKKPAGSPEGERAEPSRPGCSASARQHRSAP